MTARRVMVIGLDCAAPAMVFGRYRDDMPVLSSLMARGTWGPLRSTVPPITVPAWACMVTGLDPGQLGLYGFRARRRAEYAMRLVSSRDLVSPRVWDLVGEAGKRVAVLYVPPSYPPPGVRGELVSCFLTPGTDSPHTFPPSLQEELRERFGPPLIDIEDFRNTPKRDLLHQLRAMAEQHFSTAEYIWQTREPDFLMMVEIGIDRLHHAFWQYLDPSHPDYTPQNPFRRPCRDYFSFVDEKIGRLCAAAGSDTAVLVVSDHGARTMRGGICINEWLIEQGYLVLRRYPAEVTSFDSLEVDWEQTRAWGEGGYYARILLNVEGREPRGSVPAAKADREREDLAARLRLLPGPNGETLDNRVVHPREIYREVVGCPPDLCAFFGNMDYRSVGSVGHRTLYAPLNDRGPDGCNHDWNGIFVMSGGGAPQRGRVEGYEIYDVASTILGLMDLPIPGSFIGVDRSR
jgi:predicted AlkP superfamily phosphohydrolase/phosphomutase